MAAKKKTSETSAQSEALHHPPVDPATPEAPFDDATLGASGDAAFDVLAKVDAKKHEALVAAWVARRNAAAVAAIANRDDAPAIARKAARRAINVLKSRGVAIPERATSASLVAKPEFTFEARAMYPDGRGAQIFWIAKIAKTGGTDVIEVTTVDRLGVVSVNRGNPSAGNLRQIWNGWVSRAGRAPTEVPVEFARRRIAEARATSVARKAVLPMGIDGAKELLGDLALTDVPHPLDGEDLVVPSAEDAVKARIERSMHLHEEPEFASWMPDDAAGVALIQSINERVQKLGVIPGSPPDEEQQKQIDVSVNEAIDDATNAYFDDEKKKLYQARLKDSAWSLYKAGIIDRAVDALLVGGAISRAGVISDRPSEIPFVRGMFVKVVAIAQQRAAALAPTGVAEAERLEG